MKQTFFKLTVFLDILKNKIQIYCTYTVIVTWHIERVFLPGYWRLVSRKSKSIISMYILLRANWHLDFFVYFTDNCFLSLSLSLTPQKNPSLIQISIRNVTDLRRYICEWYKVHVFMYPGHWKSLMSIPSIHNKWVNAWDSLAIQDMNRTIWTYVLWWIVC